MVFIEMVDSDSLFCIHRSQVLDASYYGIQLAYIPQLLFTTDSELRELYFAYTQIPDVPDVAYCK